MANRCNSRKDAADSRCSNVVNVTAVGQIFVCEICGNVVEVTEVGGGELVCCGEPMVERK